MDTKKLVSELQAVPMHRLYHASFKAQVRLQLYFTSLTHELFLEFGRRANAMTLRAGGRDAVLDGLKGYTLQSDLLKVWGDTFAEWQAKFQKARQEAAMIPFGVVALTHEKMVKPTINDMTEAVKDGVFSPQVRILMQVADEYLYPGSNLNLSARIWQIDREARQGINQVLMSGIANSSSPLDIARQLEQFLGANQDCPRWTSTRLYGMTAKEKTTSAAGLISGDACDGRGVSYNALRLARTELQKVHSLATDRMMAMQPWVEKEQIHLSAAHPEHDICDETVAGGEDGEGIYPKGEIELPLHPNCLCYKTAVLMDEKQFTSRLGGWMKGTEQWPALDKYAQDIGGDMDRSIMPQAINMAVWLFGTDLTEWLQ